VVEGKTSYVFRLSDGRPLKGTDLLTREDWHWRDSPHLPGGRYARLTATSPTYGPVTLVLVAQPGRTRCYLLSRATDLTALRLVRAGAEGAGLSRPFGP
jgi:hypothetical protein